jgi:hypothetical protein
MFEVENNEKLIKALEGEVIINSSRINKKGVKLNMQKYYCIWCKKEENFSVGVKDGTAELYLMFDCGNRFYLGEIAFVPRVDGIFNGYHVRIIY